MIAELVTSLAIAFALVASRMAAFVLVSPFPGSSTPTQVRVGLTLLLAVVATPLVSAARAPAFGPGLVGAALAEMAVGAVIGFVFRVAMSAAEVLGAALAHALGLSFASSYDPIQATSTDALSRLVTSVAMLVAFAVGAHRVVLGAVIASYRAVPLGAGLDLDVASTAMLAWVERSLECGLGLAVPAMAVALVVQVALGLVARAAPALQIFSVGLAVSLGSGLLVMMAGAADSLAGLAAHMSDLRIVLERVLASPS